MTSLVSLLRLRGAWLDTCTIVILSLIFKLFFSFYLCPTRPWNVDDFFVVEMLQAFWKKDIYWKKIVVILSIFSYVDLVMRTNRWEYSLEELEGICRFWEVLSSEVGERPISEIIGLLVNESQVARGIFFFLNLLNDLSTIREIQVLVIRLSQMFR